MEKDNAKFPYTIYDAHHHLWNLSSVEYPWLNAKGVKRFFGDPAPIQKNYLAKDFQSDINALPVKKSVHIQVGADDPLAETAWLQNCSDEHGFPHAIVAYCDLENKDRNASLDQLQEHSALKGIRQIIGRHPEEDAQHGTSSLLSNTEWHKGLKELAMRNLSFDLQIIPDQMKKMYQILKNLEHLQVVICHAGSPWYRDSQGWKIWQQGLLQLAKLPNVHCKLSGLGMFDREWSVESLRPVFDTVLETFGTERVMFGSNFPVDKLYGPYDKLWWSYLELCQGLSDIEKINLFQHNCKNFYKLED
ncbi:MAG: amidohydrolase family protein [Gammaproteobacteria bacterium]|nr:amidohydrolase family protein [Gammaproteobacteria bacterium]NNM14592.1 amidohydrolase family protein [Gammaproteobacteria bacterium]